MVVSASTHGMSSQRSFKHKMVDVAPRLLLTEHVAVQVSGLTIDTTQDASYAVTKPRDLRIEYPSAIYHVLNRRGLAGDQRDDIFLDEKGAPIA